MKTIKIKIYPTKCQKQIINNFIDTHRFVYNRTLDYVKKQGYEPYFEDLRNLLATEKSRSTYSATKYYNICLNNLKEKNCLEKEQFNFIKNEINKTLKQLPLLKNPLIYDFELATSNEIRSNAIKSVCDAYKTGYANLKAGNIKYFNMSFKKKTNNKKCIELASTDIQFTEKGIKISPQKFPINEKIIKIHKKNHKKYKDLIIKNNCDLIKINENYYIHITVPYTIKQVNKIKPTQIKYCGIDPGVRTFVSIYGNNELSNIDLKNNNLENINKKINILKSKNVKPLQEYQRSGFKRRNIAKLEKNKVNIIDSLHWNVCNYLTEKQDIIFLGDIKSHNIVKKSYNKTLNRQFNDLKFYKFKQRLLYKCVSNNKKVFFINEAYTSQSCSSCGNLWKELGTSKTYICQNENCKKIFDRDMNAAKNICMKGILLNTN
jgi:IS605 OrfB family transposase